MTAKQETRKQQELPNTGFIRDRDCTKDTPVVFGVPDTPIYGTGKRIRPRISGREDSGHMKKILLPELLPLEDYDLVVVLLSGGKDSIACYYKLLELGVPKEKFEFWHHDIDGGHPSRRMDWRCTQNYVRAFAEAEGVPLRTSWRVNGFFGELYRIGASEPVEWMDPETGEICQCKDRGLEPPLVFGLPEDHGSGYSNEQLKPSGRTGTAWRETAEVPRKGRYPPGTLVQWELKGRRPGQRDSKPGEDQE